MLIAVYIIWSAIEILRDAAEELLDRGLPREVEDEVKALLPAFAPEVRGYHAFRSRRAGGTLVLRVSRCSWIARPRSSAPTTSPRRRSDASASATAEHAEVMVDTDPV